MTTIIDQIEIKRDGFIQVRMKKIVTVNSVDHDLGYHRTGIEPGGDVDARMALVNTHLQQMGLGQVEASDISRLKAVIPVVHTPEVVASYRAAKTAALRSQP